MANNPFKPSTGASPPEIIGRQPVLDAIGRSLDEGVGAPGRISLLTGQRGVGKTVMLSEASDLALSRGWHVVDLTATPGLLARLDAEVSHLLLVEDPPAKRRVTGAQVAGVGGMTFEPTPDLVVDVRRKLGRLLELLGKRGSGLMVTVDEVHAGARSDLRELSALTQHLIRDERDLALVMAGLPAAVSGLLNDEVLTFLRRADRHLLSALDVDDVQDALGRTIAAHGRHIEPAQSRRAAEASRGYPYLVQLVGYHIWRQARGDRIGPKSVDEGTAEAIARLATLVHEPALQDLSEVDRRFLVAMAEDDGRTAVADLARRLVKDRHYVNTYRRRLIAAQVIEEAGRGHVRFTIPYLRDHLREEYL